jgi:RNA polymerase sigma factor (sigma-70 family)
VTTFAEHLKHYSHLDSNGNHRPFAMHPWVREQYTQDQMEAIRYRIMRMQEQEREDRLSSTPVKFWQPEVDFLKRDLRRSMLSALLTLTPREARILIMRFGLTGEPWMRLTEVAELEGVSKDRIRQIETKALRKLRHPSRSRKLIGYLQALPS